MISCGQKKVLLESSDIPALLENFKKLGINICSPASIDISGGNPLNKIKGILPSPPAREALGLMKSVAMGEKPWRKHPKLLNTQIKKPSK